MHGARIDWALRIGWPLAPTSGLARGLLSWSLSFLLGAIGTARPARAAMTCAERQCPRGAYRYIHMDLDMGSQHRVSSSSGLSLVRCELGQAVGKWDR